MDPNVKGAMSEMFDKSQMSESIDVPAGCERNKHNLHERQNMFWNHHGWDTSLYIVNCCMLDCPLRVSFWHCLFVNKKGSISSPSQ